MLDHPASRPAWVVSGSRYPVLVFLWAEREDERTAGLHQHPSHVPGFAILSRLGEDLEGEEVTVYPDPNCLEGGWGSFRSASEILNQVHL